MPNLDVRAVATYQAFVDAWHGDDHDLRLLWQLLGQLDADKVLVRIPEWLAEEKADYGDGPPPTGSSAASSVKSSRPSCWPIRRRHDP